MQGKIYCPKCRKYVSYHIKEVIKEGNIEGYNYNYLGEASVCDECKTITYTTDNIRRNIDKSYEAYYRRLKEEERQKRVKKGKNKLIIKVVSGVILLTAIIAVIKRNIQKKKL